MKLIPFLFRPRDLVITIHGFGRRTCHEMDPLAEALENAHFEVIRFSYYDPDDLDDVDPAKWIVRCEQVIARAVRQKRRIHLLGFSMGGVIASYLASIYPVCDLLLAAPAFYPFDFSKIEQAARKKLTSDKSPSMSSVQTKAFMKIVSSYRDSILHVDCPVLILHGTDDEVISPASSEKMYARILNHRKALLWIQGAKHRFLYDGPFESLAFSIIRDYFQGEIELPMLS